MKKSIISIVIVFIALSLPGCFHQDQAEGEGFIDSTKRDRAITSCQIECRRRKEIEDYGSGPCLNNSVQPDWACDIAHDPRQVLDNYPENLCSAYQNGTVNHFIELDPNCNLLQAE
ncbi:MAG: hypothetical protein ABIB97_06155 [Patescibacteria group bacterium]